jgi:hypothetical protein
MQMAAFVGYAMNTSMNYPKLLMESLRLAETADGRDAFEAFMALAEVWKRLFDLERKNGRATRPLVIRANPS